MSIFVPGAPNSERDRALAMFCRAPVPGQVKTRLAAFRGHDFAAQLYAAMLRDTLALAKRFEREQETDPWVFFSPHNAFESTRTPSLNLGSYWTGLRQEQVGEDLGERMRHCLNALLARGYGKVVLIGSDSPDLPLERISSAFQGLLSNDVVLGDSSDGGFYLIGTRTQLTQEFFQGVQWSRSDTRLRLEAQISRSGLSLERLPEWTDVDEWTDVEALCHRLKNLGTHAPHTSDFLRSQQLL